jgi:hypothetical protein
MSLLSLKDIYYSPDNAASFGGLERLYKEAKKQGIITKKSDVREFLQSQNAFNKYRPYRRKYERRRIVVPGSYYLIQADLLVLDKIGRVNKGYKYILSVIDVFSKKAYAEPIKKKTGREVVQALEKIFTMFTEKPKFLQVDEGKEFFNSNVKLFLKTHNVVLFHNYSDTKAAVIERFQRTLMMRLQRYFEVKGTNRYIDILQNIINSYNNSVHRSIGRTPNSVDKYNEMETWLHLYKDLIKKEIEQKPPFKIGDYVRIKTVRSIFFKGYKSGFSEAVFKVQEVVKSYPTTYKLVEQDGTTVLGIFYKEELSKVII